MDYWKCLLLLLTVFCLIKVISSLTIQFDADGVGLLGSDDTTLSCAFSTEDNEKIDRIVLTAKNVSENNFLEIAVFDPNIPISSLTKDGNYLSSRVVLSNITSSSTFVNLLFTSLECIDEREYECKISYNVDLIYRHEQTKTTNVTVKANPAVPIFLWEVSPLTEGDNASFTCVGNVGKPPEAFIWQMRYGGFLADPYKNVTTSSTWLSDQCSYYGTSNLIIQVTDEDNNAIIRCSIHDLQGEAYYNESQPLNVKYKVRTPNITRQPMRDEYLEGSDGPGKIKLTCTGIGNPQPTYTWYKDGNMNETLNTTSTMYITDVITNNSGIYRCDASNNVSGIEYTETTTVNIRIVKERTTTTTTKATTTKHKDSSTEKIKDDKDIATVGGIVGGIGAVVVVAVIIVIIVYIVKQRKRSDPKTTEVTMRPSVPTGDGYVSVSFENGNGVRNKQGESQSHQNMGNDPSAVDKRGYQNLGYDPNPEKKGYENVKNEDDHPKQDTGYEYASVDEATKMKNRKDGEQPNANQESLQQANVEDPYGESKDDTYDRLGQQHPHKTEANAELYDKASALSEQSQL